MNNQERYATGAAIDICNEPWKGRGADLLFIHPIRRRDKLDHGDSMLAIPTMHLSEIFDNKCQALSAHDKMKLFDASRMHCAGWQHERKMHLGMFTDGKVYKIFNGDDGSVIGSAPHAFVGTASALRDAVRNEVSWFYWFSTFVDFPGVDGILVDEKSIYALQATIADAYRKPDAGLKKAWEAIGAAFAQDYDWHFVVVNDKKVLAERYVRELGTHLRGVFLGDSVDVPVWGCFLEGGFGSL